MHARLRGLTYSMFLTANKWREHACTAKRSDLLQVFKRENLWQLSVLSRSVLNFCVRSTPPRVHKHKKRHFVKSVTEANIRMNAVTERDNEGQTKNVVNYGTFKNLSRLKQRVSQTINHSPDTNTNSWNDQVKNAQFYMLISGERYSFPSGRQ